MCCCYIFSVVVVLLTLLLGVVVVIVGVDFDGQSDILYVVKNIVFDLLTQAKSLVPNKIRNSIQYDCIGMMNCIVI